ncbi:MAG: outer membrane lipoprotein-sorting protein [Archangium sp.]
MKNVFVVALSLTLAAPAFADMSKEEMHKLLEEIDTRQRNGGDYKALAYLEQKEKDKADVVRELLIYRRDADDKLMLLFTKPKSEEGKGYLRLDKNLWSYDPGTGKWERTTERERIGGTNSRRSDFDESRLAEEYVPAFDGEEKLGKFDTLKLTLKVKDGVDVAYPIVKTITKGSINTCSTYQRRRVSVPISFDPSSANLTWSPITGE